MITDHFSIISCHGVWAFIIYLKFIKAFRLTYFLHVMHSDIRNTCPIDCYVLTRLILNHGKQDRLCFLLANSAVPHIYLSISNHQIYASSFPFCTKFLYKSSVTLMAYTSQQVWRDQCIIKGFQCKYCPCLVQRQAWMWCFQESLWHFWKKNMTASVYESLQTKNPWRNQKRQVFIALGVQNSMQHSAAA